MNSLFTLLGIETWKPIFTALLLPPVPLLLLIVVGARLIVPRRRLGWAIILLSIAGIWLTSTMGLARVVERSWLDVPAPLSAQRVRQIRADAQLKASAAIVVLGGGVEPFAPEYGVSALTPFSLERLVFGTWLSRETGLPIAFSGGSGWAQRQAGSEAEVAARIAAQDLARPLKWTEDQSRDTRENAARSVPLLKAAGVRHILLVTHGWHMPRAKRAFDEIATRNGVTVEAAPMGLGSHAESPILDWLPSTLGAMRTRQCLREGFGRWFGA